MGWEPLRSIGTTVSRDESSSWEDSKESDAHEDLLEVAE